MRSLFNRDFFKFSLGFISIIILAIILIFVAGVYEGSISNPLQLFN